MSKRRSPPGIIPTTGPLTFTIDEVFAWVCAKQGIRNPNYLSDACWYFLWEVAGTATRKLNALFAAAIVEAQQ